MAAAEDACCPPGSWPSTTDEGAYRNIGTTESLSTGTAAYVTGDAASKRAVVLCSDVFGIGGRRPAIADELARDCGCLVVLPDLQKGGSAENAEDIREYLRSYPWEAIEAEVDATFELLKRKGADTKVVSIGLCYGVWAAFQMSARGYPLCGVGGPHPSIHIERFAFGRDPVALCKLIKCPAILLPAGNDPPPFHPGGEAAQAVLDAFPGKSVVVSFPEQKHGWTSRGDLGDPAVKRDTAKAMELLKAFVNARFSDDS